MGEAAFERATKKPGTQGIEDLETASKKSTQTPLSPLVQKSTNQNPGEQMGTVIRQNIISRDHRRMVKFIGHGQVCQINVSEKNYG